MENAVVGENAQAAGFERHVDAVGRDVERAFAEFLQNFRKNGEDAPEEPPSYLAQMRIMRTDDRTTLYIDFADVLAYSADLAEQIVSEYYRLEPFLRAALLSVIKLEHADYIRGNRGVREFSVAFYGLPAIQKIRDLKTRKIGQLLTIIGTVTRTSEVRPELVTGAFACLDCSTRVRNVEQQFKYTEPLICTNETCQNRSNWELLVDESRFADWQRVRVQENSSEIPAGSMPRSMDVIVRNEIVDRAKPGDKAVFTGCLIVVPDVSQLAMSSGRVDMRSGAGRPQEGAGAEGSTGLKALGVRELTYKLSFLACMIQPADARFGTVNIRDDNTEETAESVLQQYTAEEQNEIIAMRKTPNLYGRLASSLAPSVFGHDEIKRGVLLMLFGGVHKTSLGGTSLRGDINVCIVGDPSTAKSQFLKYVVSFLPRAVYTSGKASTAAGLTASVVKDDETGEFTIEAGALMLADNGVCCIDEFDKMDIADQVAIHEAMEQQTISIAKAGIQATLNARTSILAAANPQGGRYDQRRSLKSNVNMSPAIMSRFDLFFVIVDECDETADYNIAKHILDVHRKGLASIEPEFSTEQLQRYIKYARTFKPRINAEAQKLLVEHYRKLRQNDSKGAGVGGSSYRITVRQLESMIRLAEALARLNCDNEVTPGYVREAYRLLRKSIIHVETDEVELDDIQPPADEEEEGADAAAKEPQAAVAPAPAVIKITLEKYQTLANMLVLHLRRNDEVDRVGMKRGDLVNWYLEQKEDELANEQALNAERELINRVIENLLTRDHILIALRQPTAVAEDDTLLVVHPNYTID